MAEQSPAQKGIVARVMHEFKHGELDKPDGEPVKNPKQAIAIALHEAGSSNQESPKTNRTTLRRTKQKERSGQTAQAQIEGKTKAGGPRSATKAALVSVARRRAIPGRSRMDKAALERALGR